MMISQPSAKGSRPGDWICPGCNDLVFAKNDFCRRCSTPKPGTGAAAGYGPAAAGYAAGFAPVQDASYPSRAATGNNQTQKPGDWICPSCGDLQFARNTQCRRCGAPAPAPGPVTGGYDPGYSMGGCMGGGMGGYGMGSGGGGCGMGGGMSMGGGGPPQKEMRPGDWLCPGCGDHVFAKNDSCRRCGMPRPGAAGGHSQAALRGAKKSMPGDWNCPKCGDLQFARNSSCRMCSTPKPDDRGRSRSPIRR